MPNIVTNLQGSDTILIAFSSLNHNDDKVDRYDFANVTNSRSFDSVLVRDLTNRWYLGGVDQWSDADAFSEHLGDLCRPYRRSIFIGSSMGGFGAVYYGAAVGASQVIAIAPQTNMTASFLAEIDDRRWEPYVAGLSTVTVEPLALKPSRQYQAPVYLVCPTLDPGDLGHAAYVAEHANVEIDHVSGHGHHLAGALRQSGHLRKLITAAIDGDSLSDVLHAFRDDTARQSAGEIINETERWKIDLIGALYRRLLRREPDEAGLVHNINILDSDGVDELVRAFVESEEFMRNVVYPTRQDSTT